MRQLISCYSLQEKKNRISGHDTPHNVVKVIQNDLCEFSQQ